VSARSQGRRFRQTLIIGEIALALILAVAAGLLVQTVRAVQALPLGFDTSKVISIGLSPDLGRVQRTTGKAQYEKDLVGAIRRVPGVVSAGVGPRPLAAGSPGIVFAFPESPSERIRIDVSAAGPGYLEALGATLKAGRFIREDDGAGVSAVAVVNEAARRQYFSEDPLGRVILVDDTPTRIVGIIENVRMTGLEEDPAPMLYLPTAQTRTFWTNNILVRTTGDPRDLLPAVRTVVQRVDPELPLTRIQTLEETLAKALAPRQFTLSLVGLFSGVALVLARVGVYGVVTDAVGQRVPEIGVRMAMGATPASVLGLILRQGGAMAVAGAALGTAGALSLSGVMSAFVFRIGAIDPWTYLAAAVVVVSSALGACAIPARRASRIDPVLALRQE
jgi:putative ABC transport system permease protein